MDLWCVLHEDTARSFATTSVTVLSPSSSLSESKSRDLVDTARHYSRCYWELSKAKLRWAAASGQVSLNGMILPAALYFWQLPHFMALAYMCRNDYAAGGFRMFSLADPSGRRTASVALRNCLYLVPLGFLAYDCVIDGDGRERSQDRGRERDERGSGKNRERRDDRDRRRSRSRERDRGKERDRDYDYYDRESRDYGRDRDRDRSRYRH